MADDQDDKPPRALATWRGGQPQRRRATCSFGESWGLLLNFGLGGWPASRGTRVGERPAEHASGRLVLPGSAPARRSPVRLRTKIHDTSHDGVNTEGII